MIKNSTIHHCPEDDSMSRTLFPSSRITDRQMSEQRQNKLWCLTAALSQAVTDICKRHIGNY